MVSRCPNPMQIDHRFSTLAQACWLAVSRRARHLGVFERGCMGMKNGIVAAAMTDREALAIRNPKGQTP
jgi:hypothetical protein